MRKTMILEWHGYEGYQPIDLVLENKDTLARQMKDLVDDESGLIAFVKPSKKTLGAKAFKVYKKLRREKLRDLARRRAANKKGMLTRKLNEEIKKAKAHDEVRDELIREADKMVLDDLMMPETGAVDPAAFEPQ